MRVALINPCWTFEGSIYFGCREPHLPLEFGYARALLEREGHQVLLVDGHRDSLSNGEVVARLQAFRPDMTAITTAPTYLFWRCPPPELRVPKALLSAVRGVAGRTVIVGPHGSTTPEAVLRKLMPDVVVMGECEEALVELTRLAPGLVRGTCFQDGPRTVVNGGPRAVAMADLPPLHWPGGSVAQHRHHHHRFDAAPTGPGAEVETSRGCPYHCSFCAKENFRNAYRRRPLPVVLDEIDGLCSQGVEYVYFVDEIFLPHRPLLEALVGRPVAFGVQTRIDLWKPETLALLGRAGCVSIEAGVESLTAEGRHALAKDCRIGLEELTALLIEAKRHVPFVQANLIEMPADDDDDVQAWREAMQAHGIWANDPVPLFPYPGTPDYRKLWGFPDDDAWERAVDYYLDLNDRFSEIQERRPLPLHVLEQTLQ